MLNAALYSGHKSLQREGTTYILNKYIKLLKWRNNENILDVGTGDGVVMQEILLPKLPKKFKKLTGLDIDKDMLSLAQSNCKHNPKIDFFCMDMASKIIPEELCQLFDHIFSFYCLHWVINQRQAMQNIFDMLKPGGEILVTILANHPVFDVYEKMAKLDKWAPYMTDLHKNVTPYQHSVNAAKEVEAFLEGVGFADYVCDVVDQSCTHYDSLDFWKWACAINPFLPRIPTQEIESYRKDYFNELTQIPTLQIEAGRKFSVVYQMVVVFATKPV